MTLTAPQESPGRMTDGFDTRVHIKDAKTGRMIREQHYRRTSVGSIVVFERDGKFFWENGEETNREEILAKLQNFPFQDGVAEKAADEMKALEVMATSRPNVGTKAQIKKNAASSI